MPARSVETGWETLQCEFRSFMARARESPDHDDIFDHLKEAVVNDAMEQHSWEDKVCFIIVCFSYLNLNL